MAPPATTPLVILSTCFADHLLMVDRSCGCGACPPASLARRRGALQLDQKAHVHKSVLSLHQDRCFLRFYILSGGCMSHSSNISCHTGCCSEPFVAWSTEHENGSGMSQMALVLALKECHQQQQNARSRHRVTVDIIQF